MYIYICIYIYVYIYMYQTDITLLSDSYFELITNFGSDVWSKGIYLFSWHPVNIKVLTSNLDPTCKPYRTWAKQCYWRKNILVYRSLSL